MQKGTDFENLVVLIAFRLFLQFLEYWADDESTGYGRVLIAFRLFLQFLGLTGKISLSGLLHGLNRLSAFSSILRYDDALYYLRTGRLVLIAFRLFLQFLDGATTFYRKENAMRLNRLSAFSSILRTA